MLHESWNNKASDRFPIYELSDVLDSDIYLEGVTDFQTKALEELENKFKEYTKNPVGDYIFTKAYDGGLQEAIEIIKNLKAD